MYIYIYIIYIYIYIYIIYYIHFRTRMSMRHVTKLTCLGDLWNGDPSLVSHEPEDGEYHEPGEERRQTVSNGYDHRVPIGRRES